MINHYQIYFFKNIGIKSAGRCIGFFLFRQKGQNQTKQTAWGKRKILHVK